MEVKKICVVTSARSEYDLLRNILCGLEQEQTIKLYVVVTGGHLKSEFGSTHNYVRKDGFSNYIEIDIIGEGDDRRSMIKSISNGLDSFSEFLYSNKIDWLLVLGDRFEIFSAVIAARILNIPIIHFSGGDTSEGAIDDEFRHSISLMSTLHYVKLEEHKALLDGLGVNCSDVEVIGSLSVENYKNFSKMDLQGINRKFSTSIVSPFALVSFHSTTNPSTSSDNDVDLFLDTLFSRDDLFLVFSSSSADFGGLRFNALIKSWVKNNSDRSVYVSNFGRDAYFSLLLLADLMIGNSSSGILESGNFKIPVINVLPRQKGRIHNDNVINVYNNKNDIIAAIDYALTSDFKNRCNSLDNIFDVDIKGFDTISHYVVETILDRINE